MVEDLHPSEYEQFWADEHFCEVYKEWRDAVWEAGDDPVAVASANLTWQAWLGKYKADHDKHFGSCLTQEWVEDTIRRCPVPDVVVVPHDPPPWTFKEPGTCTCGYCTRRIKGARDDFYDAMKKESK